MKVKKKYIFVAAIAIFMSFVIAIGIFITLLSSLNINLKDGNVIIKSGFSFDPANNEEIREYSTESHNTIDIFHYELHLDLFPEDEKIISKAIITGLLKNEQESKIDLNFNEGFDIAGVSFNNSNINYEYDDDIISILVNPSITDTFRIEINYSGTPESLGFGSFVFGEHNEEPVVYSLNEPIFASTWFPCNDTPSDKVLTDVFITNDSSMTSLSNGLLVSTEVKGSRKTYHWMTKYPIATYLISIYSANYIHYSDEYESLNDNIMSLDYYVFEEDLDKAKKDFDIHPMAMKHLEELFGEYPFINEKYGVAEFLWSYGAMEHQTISGIGRNFIGGNHFFTGMLVHELAHQWWGNAVTLNSWKDIWLNEGFATYSEALYWEKENGFSALKSTMLSYLTNFNGTKLYNPERLFSRVIYNKGAWVLHMLRRELGDELFFKILNEYYERYKYKNASTQNFIDLVESISDRDFSKYFDQWLFNGEGKIELEYEYKQQQDDENFEISLNLSQTQDGYNSYEFLLDLDFYLEDGLKQREFIKVKKRTSNYRFSFNQRITKIDLDPDNWIAAEIKFLKSDLN